MIRLKLILYALGWMILYHFVDFELTVLGLLIVIAYYAENQTN